MREYFNTPVDSESKKGRQFEAMVRDFRDIVTYADMLDLAASRIAEARLSIAAHDSPNPERMLQAASCLFHIAKLVDSTE